MATEVEIDGRTYRLGKLSAMTQFHVSRRLLPVFTSLDGEKGEMLPRLMDAVSKLSDDDSEYVIGKCLADCAVKRDGDAGWAPIYRNGQLMFEEIGMAGMLRLTFATIEENLASFFTGLPSGSPVAGN